MPEGPLFIAYGNISSRLMGGDTHGFRMPTSKGIDVELEVLEKAWEAAAPRPHHVLFSLTPRTLVASGSARAVE
ncbi:MAG: hypothetical protein U0836_10560 [Pirellulales bacterium]